MTANKHFKRLVRARKARTGESFMTAAQHVRARGKGSGRDDGRFRAIVEKTILLAEERFNEEARLYPPRTDDKPQTGGDMVRRLMDEWSGKTSRPAESALMDYVESLDTADAAALVTLHYVGRHPDDFEKPTRALNWQRHEMAKSSVRDTALMKISERSRLHEYLRRGLEVAAASGLDIEELPLAKP